MSYGLETIKLSGRAAKVVEADFVRPLEMADMELLVDERQTQKPRQLSSLTMLSERHRNLARLLAMGKPDWECAVITGYTQSRISILKSDPAMQNLIKHYSEEKDIVFVQAHEKMAQVASTALDVLQDRLEDPEHVAKMSDGQLIEIVKTAADRSGLGPASKSEVNVNVNIADRLEAARKRAHESRMIEAKAVEVK